MNEEERIRAEVMERVKKGELKLGNAGEILAISYRQAKRIWRKYRRQGAGGLVHGNAGKGSHRAKPAKFRRRVLKLIREKYSGDEKRRFGPTLAAEHLGSEDGVAVDAETLRRWMLAEGLWSRQRKHKPHRQRRERRAHFGELLQLDGSFAEWLEERGPGGCLMDLVDDATSVTLSRLGGQETIWAAAGVLRAWIERYGIPTALYTDWKNVYVREPTAKERMKGEEPRTQFGAMCARLGIRIIAANSAPAKGRVERNHSTHQDRFIKKARRKNICTHAAANEYLKKEYLTEHNRRFARKAAEEEDYHRAKPGKKVLDQAFRLETERSLGNDWVVRHENRFYQVTPQSGYAPAGSKVQVCEWEDGRMEIWYRGQRLRYEQISERPAKTAPAAGAQKVRRQPALPSSDHPWRGDYRKMRVRGAAG
jgi:transposase